MLKQHIGIFMLHLYLTLVYYAYNEQKQIHIKNFIV